jgi:hypothetical protein
MQTYRTPSPSFQRQQLQQALLPAPTAGTPAAVLRVMQHSGQRRPQPGMAAVARSCLSCLLLPAQATVAGSGLFQHQGPVLMQQQVHPLESCWALLVLGKYLLLPRHKGRWCQDLGRLAASQALARQPAAQVA